MHSRFVTTSSFFLSLVAAITVAEEPVTPVRVHVSSQHDSDPGTKGLDGKPDTFWHTRYGEGETKHPHEITLDLGRSFDIEGFAYLPRSGAGNGTIKDYEFFVSDDHQDFGRPVAKGTFAKDAAEKQVTLSEKRAGRFVRLRALSEVNGQIYTSIAELKIFAGGEKFTSLGGGAWDPEAPDTTSREPRTGTFEVRVTVENQAPGTEAYRAMDGDANTHWRTAWQPDRRRHDHRFSVDLSESFPITGIQYTPVRGGGNGTIKDYELFVHEEPGNLGQPLAKGTLENNADVKRIEFETAAWGRYVTLVAKSEVNGHPWASMAELQILSTDDVTFRAAPPTAEEKSKLRELIQRGQRPPNGNLQDMLDLTIRTLAFVEQVSSQSRMADELRSLEKQIGQGANSGDMVKRLAELRRRMILAHPDLNFHQLLINKRPPPGYSHMCDQYLGRHSRPGPGLVVLDDWKNNPRPREILKDKLPEGSVLHPNLSYDGRRVLFSFCDHTEEDTKLRRFFIWEVQTDGNHLRQVTGTDRDPLRGWDGRQTVLIEDFDPCYLPDGGFAFITTRNQSYGRCHGGRYTPAYMLFRANLDGTGIRQLSFGEANEWDPSVLPNGRIIYTRWDYINRHDVRFQSLWTIAPDGTSTAHYYGNYSPSPCMTAEAQPVPGSHQVCCTATAHHGYTSGSVLLVDPRRGQDGLEPLTRVTPEFRWPEASDRWVGGKDGATATPFPINEHMYFIACMEGRLVGQGGIQDVNAYGIYLVDTLGGRELIYRDPAVSCFSPIPLRARPMPPAVPSQIVGLEQKQTGTFYIQNVYDGSQPIERGSIKSMRINRIYGQPNNGKPQLSLSNNEIIKSIVGTVPVGTDGSTAFRAPAGQPLQLQMLDENGMAVMTMRTTVYLQAGETATCVGCHEHRESTPTSDAKLANLTIHDPTPPAGPQYRGGFRFMKTVQPVLDRYCIECHGLKRKDAGLDLTGTRNGNYNVAHDALTGREGWVKIAYRNSETSYSEPKDYFSHAGKLASYLMKEHRNRVRLDPESMQRIVDWLDLNGQFYGDYSNNRTENRAIHSEGEKALREHITKTLGSELARQPIATLVNVALPSESRILKVPLATSAGGWGQVRGWTNTNDPNYQEMARLVDAAVQRHDAHDIGGTCGRTGCRCGTCWVRRLREARNNPPVDYLCQPFDRNPPGRDKVHEIPQDGWRLVRVDSEETDAADAGGEKAFDGDSRTYWHTQSEEARPSHPHEIVIDLGRAHRVCGFRYLPRNDVGDIKDCEFFVSDRKDRLGERVTRGTLTERGREQTVLFDPKYGRYVMLRALSSMHGGPYTSVSEVSVLTFDEILEEVAE